MFEQDPYGTEAEHVHMQTAVILDESDSPIGVLNDAGHGVVEYSVPAGGKGCVADHSPSLSGHDYIVAAWGNGSFYSFNLAEKVWMTLGLTPRCVGNEKQRLVYDDLGLPEFGVAQGGISNEYYWQATRNISWTMSNEYLRKYLWLRGARGVRVFFYQTLFREDPQLRELVRDSSHIVLKPEDGAHWYTLDIREHKGGLLVQIWASVASVTCELCPERSANGITWPGYSEPMTEDKANALVDETPIFLDDKFLQKYEQSEFYNTVPFESDGLWSCNPSYKGQWSFTGCRRVGRNLIRVPMRELYKPKPDREILHAHEFALSPDEFSHLDIEEEHIASKTKGLLDQLLRLGGNLSKISAHLGIEKSAQEIIGFSRQELQANGWTEYPVLCRLAEVAPVGMPQQEFLARCKRLHEAWQVIPNGFLKAILREAGCPSDRVRDLGLIKLLQALTNILLQLARDHDDVGSLRSSAERECWEDRNDAIAPLFLTYKLRIADAHESRANCADILQDMDFDIAQLDDGYGYALDHVMDSVVSAFEAFNSAAEQVLEFEAH